MWSWVKGIRTKLAHVSKPGMLGKRALGCHTIFSVSTNNRTKLSGFYGYWWGPHLAQWGCKQHRGRGAWHPAADIPPNAPRAPPATRMTPWGTTTLGVLRVPCRIPGVQTLWEHPGQKFPQHSRAETLGTASSSPRDCMASRAQPGEPWRRAWGYG